MITVQFAFPVKYNGTLYAPYKNIEADDKDLDSLQEQGAFIIENDIEEPEELPPVPKKSTKQTKRKGRLND